MSKEDRKRKVVTRCDLGATSKAKEGEGKDQKDQKPRTRGGERGNKENTTDLRLLQLQP